MKKYVAECFGTFWLVLGGCGSAVLAAAFPDVGIGFLGVALAFGLTVLTMAFAIGHISGCHLNPAVSIGLWAGGRFEAGQLLPYIIAQVLGAVVAGGVLFIIASGKAGFDVTAGFASNGYGTGRLLIACRFGNRGGHDHDVSAGDSRIDRCKSAKGAGAHRHRPMPDTDPSDQYPGDQYVRESCPQHGRGPFRGGLGCGPALAFLGRPDRGCHPWRDGLSVHRQSGPVAAGPTIFPIACRLYQQYTTPFDCFTNVHRKNGDAAGSENLNIFLGLLDRVGGPDYGR